MTAGGGGEGGCFGSLVRRVPRSDRGGRGVGALGRLPFRRSWKGFWGRARVSRGEPLRGGCIVSGRLIVGQAREGVGLGGPPSLWRPGRSRWGRGARSRCRTCGVAPEAARARCAGRHPARGAGTEKKDTSVSGGSPPASRPPSRRKKAPGDLRGATEPGHGRWAARPDTDCSDAAFLVHFSTP